MSGKCMQITVSGEVIVCPRNRLGILSFLYIVFLCVYRRQRAKLVCQNVCVYGCVCTLNLKMLQVLENGPIGGGQIFLKKFCSIFLKL